MILKIKKPVSILLALMMVVSLFVAVPITASAEEDCETVDLRNYVDDECNATTYTGTHFSLDPSIITGDADGWIFVDYYPDSIYATISALNGKAITKLVIYRSWYNGIPVVTANESSVAYTQSGSTFTFENINATSLRINATGDYLQVSKIDVYYGDPVPTYTVTWKNGDDVIKTDTVEEGTAPVYNGETPTKADDENYTYTFSGWTDSSNTFYSKDSNLPAVTKDETYTAQFTAKPKTLIAGHSLSLDGNIGINFYLDPSVAGLTAQEVTVDNLSYTFAWANGNPGKAKVDVAAQAAQKNFRVSEDGKYIIITCHVCAAEMTCDVDASFTLGDKTESKTYSVREYCDTVIKATADQIDELFGGTERYNKLVGLVKAMLNYGAMAQTKFKVNTGTPGTSDTPGTPGKLANEGVTYNPGDVDGDMLDAAIADANPNETADNMNNVASALGAKWFSTSLIYLDDSTLRHYFVKTTDAFKPSDYTGNKSNYYYYVEKTGIPAAELDNLQSFTAGNQTFKYSALDFVKGMITSSADGDSKNLAKSLYWYNQAANKYFA